MCTNFVNNSLFTIFRTIEVIFEVILPLGSLSQAMQYISYLKNGPLFMILFICNYIPAILQQAQVLGSKYISFLQSLVNVKVLCKTFIELENLHVCRNKHKIFTHALQIFIKTYIIIRHLQGRRSELKSTSATSRLWDFQTRLRDYYYTTRLKNQPLPWHMGLVRGAPVDI